MSRGFVVLFVPKNADISIPKNHQVVAAIGENEEDVASRFVEKFSQSRQLIGVVSLEEIEEHRRLILEHARQCGVQINRAELPDPDQ